MKIDMVPFDSWMNLNRQVMALLGTNSPPESVKCFLGAGRAVLEISQSVAQFYSHKRAIAVFSNGSPYTQNLLTYFYKEGYEVQIAPENVNPVEWVESLKKETCFVVSVEDHPVTAEIFHQESLNQALEAKRFIHLSLSHHRHLSQPLPEKNLYQVRICAFGPETAVAFFGEKVKAGLTSGYVSSWESERFCRELQRVQKSFLEDKEWVEEFESHLPPGYQPYFRAASSRRLYDRIVFYHPEIGGEMLQQYLASRCDQKVQAPGQEHSIETLHLCRWGGTLSSLDWWKPSPSQEILRGLIVADVKWARDKSLREYLIEASRECRISSAN